MSRNERRHTAKKTSRRSSEGGKHTSRIPSNTILRTAEPSSRQTGTRHSLRTHRRNEHSRKTIVRQQANNRQTASRQTNSRGGTKTDERPREWWPRQQTNEHKTAGTATRRMATTTDERTQDQTTLLTWTNNQERVLLDNELWWLRNYDDWGIMVIEGARILWSGHRMMSDVCSDQFWLGSDWWEMHKKTIVNFDGRLQIIWKIGEMKFQNY